MSLCRLFGFRSLQWELGSHWECGIVERLLSSKYFFVTALCASLIIVVSLLTVLLLEQVRNIVLNVVRRIYHSSLHCWFIFFDFCRPPMRKLITRGMHGWLTSLGSHLIGNTPRNILFVDCSERPQNDSADLTEDGGPTLWSFSLYLVMQLITKQFLRFPTAVQCRRPTIQRVKGPLPSES